MVQRLLISRILDGYKHCQRPLLQASWMRITLGRIVSMFSVQEFVLHRLDADEPEHFDPTYGPQGKMTITRNSSSQNDDIPVIYADRSLKKWRLLGCYAVWLL
jgi:hypothetical protein